MSRYLEFPRMFSEPEEDLLYDQIFMFAGGNPESIVWRVYARSPKKVHRLGKKVADIKTRRRGRKIEYRGFITSTAGIVREVKSKNNNGFRVLHHPSAEEGIHHGHICYSLVAGVSKLKKSEKTDLKKRLFNVFSEPTWA